MEEHPTEQPRTPSPAASGCAGCLLFPAGMGGLMLALGIWLMTTWSANAPAVNVLSILLVAIGGLMVLAIGALVLIATLLARFARNAKRDAKSFAYSMKYMMNMGRMGNEKPGDVVVEAQEITAEEIKPRQLEGEQSEESKKDDQP